MPTKRTPEFKKQAVALYLKSNTMAPLTCTMPAPHSYSSTSPQPSPYA